MARPNNINAGVFSGIINASKFCLEYRRILLAGIQLKYRLPSYQQQIKQDRLLRKLKQDGIWNLLDIFYIFATDGDSDWATLNWANPSAYQITKVSSPTFTANQGFTGNGSSSYLNTGWAPNTGIKYTLTNGSAFADCQTNAGTNAAQLFGAGANDVSTNVTRLNPRNAANQGSYGVNDNAPTTVTGQTNSIGFYHVQRTPSGQRSLFKNGISIDSGAGGGTARPPNNMYILACSVNAGATQFRAAKVGIFGAGNSLAGKELTLYNYWNNYFTNL